MTHQSWTRRRQGRGGGLTFPRPPKEIIHLGGFHYLRTPDGERRRLLWAPGTEVWWGPNQERIPVEVAAKNGWTYAGPADASGKGES